MLLFVLLVLGGIATGVWTLFREEADPTAVVVAVRGCSSACQHSLGRRVAIHLEEAGFDVRPHVDEEVPPVLANAEDLGDLADAASELGAAHAVWVLVQPIDRREGAIGAASSAVGVRVVTQTMTRGEDARASQELIFAVEVDEPDPALLEAGMRGVDALAPAVASELLGSPTVAAYLSETPVDMERFNAINEGRRADERRRSEMDRFEQSCVSTVEELGQRDAFLGDVRCLTTDCGQEYLIGVLPGGSEAVLRVETAMPVFPLFAASDVRTAQVPDRLVRVSTEGIRTTLVSVQNLYSYADLAQDGQAVAYVEIADRIAKLVWVSIDGAERRELHRVPWPERMTSPHLSPEADWVAFTYRAFRRAEPKLYVMRTAPTPPEPGAPAEFAPPFEPERFGVSGRWVRLPMRVTDGDPTRAETLLAVVVPGERSDDVLEDEGAEEGDDTDESDIEEELVGVNPERAGLDLPPLTHIALLRMTEGEPELVARIGGVERPVRQLIGSHEGRLVVSSYSRVFGCAFGIFDPNAAPPLVFTSASVCPGNPSLTPDGMVVGEARMSRDEDPEGRDGELVMVDPTTGHAVPFSANTIRDRYPTVVATPGDGRRVFFERLPRRRYARHPPAGTCFADLPEIDMTPPAPEAEAEVEAGETQPTEEDASEE